MDFELTDERRLIRETAREFIDKEIAERKLIIGRALTCVNAPVG